MAYLIQDNALDAIERLPDDFFDLAVTSCPYYRKKRYIGTAFEDESALEIGQEDSSAEFVRSMVAVGKALLRVVRPTGTFWLNVDDTLAGSGGPGGDYRAGSRYAGQNKSKSPASAKEVVPNKSLLLIPQRIAIGLQEAGWIVRCYAVWPKGNKVEGGVRDRPHHAWEPWIMMTRRNRGYYAEYGRMTDVFEPIVGGDRNYKHPAPYPEDIVKPIVLAACPPGGWVFDPFVGSGTTAVVAETNGRHAVGIDLDPKSIETSMRRLIDRGQRVSIVSGAQFQEVASAADEE